MLLISSLDSSAAFLPISGSLHAHKPPVITFQIFSFFSANELYNACESVFIAINSTHSNPHSIILLTEFNQPQPTQITFILAIGEIEFEISISSGQVLVFVIADILPESKFFNLSSLVILLFLLLNLIF